MLLHFNLEYMRLKSGIQFDWNAKRIKIDHYWKTCIMRIFVDVGWFVARTTTISVRERCGNWCYCCWCTVMWKSKSMMECIESIFTFIIMRHAYCITLLYTINKHYTHTQTANEVNRNPIYHTADLSTNDRPCISNIQRKRRELMYSHDQNLAADANLEKPALTATKAFVCGPYCSRPKKSWNYAQNSSTSYNTNLIFILHILI